MERLLEVLVVTAFTVGTFFIVGLSLEFIIKTIYKFMRS